MKNERMQAPERLFVHTASFQEGIVPMETISMDVRRALKDVPPEEARKMKRKFRKLWRKLARAGTKRTQTDVEFDVKKHVTPKAESAAEGPKEGHKPTKRAKLRRKDIVSAYIMTEHVRPMLEKFKKIERK